MLWVDMTTAVPFVVCELDIYQDEAEKAEVLGRNLTSIRRKDIPALRKEMGIIFQDFKLLTDRTIYKNLQFVLKATGWKKKDEINQRIEEVLTDVGLLDKKDNLPHELSGGEQQRIAIARALLNHPKVIIADEPTGNLDSNTSDDVMRTICEVMRSRNKTLEKKQLLTDTEYNSAREKYEDDFKAGMGAEAIRELLKEIDVEKLSKELRFIVGAAFKSLEL